MWIQPGSGDELDVLFRKSEIQREIFAGTFTVLSDLQYRTEFWESGVPSNPQLTGHAGSWEFSRQCATPRLLKGVLAVTVLPSHVGWAQPFPDWESSTLGPGAMRLPSDSPSLLSR